MKYLIPFLVLLVASFNLFNDVHWPPWVALCVIVSFYAGYLVWKIHSLSAGIALTYTLVTITIQAFYKPLNVGVMHEILMLKALSLETGFILLLLTFTFLYLNTKDLNHVRNGMILVFGIQAVWLTYDVLTGYKGIQGLLGNKSIGSSYLALVGMLNPWLSVAALAVILVTKSSISGVAIVVGVIGTLIARTRNCLVFTVVGAAMLAAVVLLDEQKLPDMPRWGAWDMFITHWIDGGKHFFGEGQGSFMFWGPKAQLLQEFEVQKGLWLWMHSDWMQLMIETGLVGLVVYLNLFRSVLVKFYREQDWEHFGMTLCLGVLMLGNYPLALAIFAIPIFYLLAQVQRVRV